MKTTKETEQETGNVEPCEVAPQVEMLDIRSLRPSEENDELYEPPEADGWNLDDLAESIETYGILEPFVATQDLWIVSGHRRRLAIRRKFTLASKFLVPVIRLPKHRADFTDEEFSNLLKQYNKQRRKTPSEVLREARSEPRNQTISEIFESIAGFQPDLGIDLEPIDPGNPLPPRNVHVASKRDFLNAALNVLRKLRDFWPVTCRSVHYQLFGNPPLRCVGHPNSIYQNTKQCADDLSRFLARCREQGVVPESVIHDPTRRDYPNLGFATLEAFFKYKADSLIDGYWSRRQEGQERHVEVLLEKSALESIVAPVCQKYGVPLSVGRGQAPTETLKRIIKRFKNFGRRRLILLILADADPAGDEIAQSPIRRLHHTWEVPVTGYRVALTPAQARSLGLPPAPDGAKPESPTFQKYVERHNTSEIWELDSMSPETLQSVVESAIRKSIEIDKFKEALRQENKNLQRLADWNPKALKALSKIKL